ncbi:hypothetical protein GOP47_0010351 [Adiantum capillus-veneris]|uniref:Kinesin-like protein n=1 Tax=Adiantum capillus-veneris TaxID=13818 RepID=A0A9D4UV43_ADICA|nr:hypothetical protein GOP47_0010351 [Adiantum capillus-veneris]
MLNPRVYTPAGKSRFAPSSQTPRPLPPPPAPPRASPECSSSKVRVVARIRPFLPSEIHGSHGKLAPCVSFSADQSADTTLHIKDSTTSREGYYKVDSCYGEDDEISGIFSKEVEPLIPALFQGKNATVFAYGATGSGKTYTMQGSEIHPGLMPLAMSRILALSERNNFQVAVAYYEVYMDRCYDLLESKGMEISVLEGNDGKIQLRGLSQVLVKTLADFNDVFVNGCLRRRVGQTGLNNTSSRSHGVLMVTVASLNRNTIFGKLNLIDLAGNEDNRRTGNEGVRLAESARINQDLFTLSNVISALSSNESRVPYRDSKLTRILQDSLGGTSRAVMIVCLNPRSYQEAAHTLIIAARTRQITNQNTEKKEDPLSKIDMGSKLQLWLEAKGKLSSVSPSPGKAKPLFYTPSHHHMNQSRRMAKNLPADMPKARRVLVLHQPNCGTEKENAQVGTASLIRTRDLALRTSMNASNAFDDHNNSCLCQTRGDDSSDLSTVKGTEPLPSYGVEANKENLCNVMDVTPSIKVPIKPSSPPLSERLHKLRDAMKDLLQPPPVCDSKPIEDLPEPKPCASGNVEALSPRLPQMKFSPSPVRTPLLPTRIDGDENMGTPFEKLSKKSSGIKNTMAKELLEFLNTASREELLELKGIGEKRAAYILSLREGSPEPLKEIEDLEKIGISQKQAQSLFKGTARHILFA